MDQDEIWHGGRPWPWPHCVKWGPSLPPKKGHSPPSHNFWPMSVVAKRLDGLRYHLALAHPGGPRKRAVKRLWWCGWYGVRPWPRQHCVRRGPSSPPQKGGIAAPNFWLMYCCQTDGWTKMPLDMETGVGPCHIVLDGDPAPPKNGHSPPIFGPCLLWPNIRPSQLLPSTCS